jgi:hypothetical protein
MAGTTLLEFLIVTAPDGTGHYAVTLRDGNMLAKLGPFDEIAEAECAMKFMKDKAQKIATKYFQSERYG